MYPGGPKTERSLFKKYRCSTCATGGIFQKGYILRTFLWIYILKPTVLAITMRLCLANNFYAALKVASEASWDELDGGGVGE